MPRALVHLVVRPGTTLPSESATMQYCPRGAWGAEGTNSVGELRGILLTIETSHTPGSVALARCDDTGVSVETITFPPGLVHAREALPAIERVVREAGIAPADLTHIGVSAGPGSYTGVRIGVAAAKTIAYATDAHVLGVSTLEVIAENVTTPGQFAVILDARRGACYGARFERDSHGELHRRSADTVTAPAEFLATLPSDTHLVGEGAATETEKGLEGTATFPRHPVEWDLPRAESVVAATRRRWRAIEAGEEARPAELDDPHTLVPNYLRASEAEEQRARREREAKERGDSNAEGGR